MDMQAFNRFRQFVFKLMQGCAQPRPGRARVIFYHFPFRMHRIDAQAQLGISGSNLGSEAYRLLRGVDDYMAREPRNLVDFGGFKSGGLGTDMATKPALREFCFPQARRAASVEIRTD